MLVTYPSNAICIFRYALSSIRLENVTIFWGIMGERKERRREKRANNKNEENRHFEISDGDVSPRRHINTIHITL